MAADMDSFRVSPGLARMPTLSATPVENSAPVQLQRAGQAVQGAGQAAANIYTDVLQEQNRTRVTEAMTQLTERRNLYTYDPNDGYTARRGRDALQGNNGNSLDEEFGGLLDEDIERLSLGLDTETQRTQFREHAAQMALDFRQRVATHASQEDRTYRLETHAGLVDASVRQLALAQGEDEIAEALGNARAGLAEIGRINGNDPVVIENATRNALSPGHLAQINSRLDAEDVAGAEAYLNQHRGDLTPDAVTRVNAAIVEQRTTANGRRIGLEVAGVAGAANAAAEPQRVIMPVVGDFRVTGQFGEARPGHAHGGVDFATPMGTAVVASADGVVSVRNEPGGFGNYVVLTLDNGEKHYYAHLSGADVQDGARVTQGTQVGRTGNSGRSTGPHLHYEIRRADGTKVDPREYHQSRPTVTRAGVATMPLADQITTIYERQARGEITSREAEVAVQTATQIDGARRQARAESQDAVISRAWDYASRNKSITPSLLSELSGLGLGQEAARLRGFVEDEQRRAAGAAGGVSDDASLLNYASARDGIAAGRITNYVELARVVAANPVSDSDFRTLTNLVTDPDRETRGQADRDTVFRGMDDEIKDARLFHDEQGNITDAAGLARLRSSVMRTFDRMHQRGEPPDEERRRAITLGLTREYVMSNGTRMRGYNIERAYMEIPAARRLQIERQLRNSQANGRVTQRQVVDYFNRTQ